MAYGGITPTASRPVATTGGYKGVSATPVAPIPTPAPTPSPFMGGINALGGDVAGVLSQPRPQSVPVTPENYLAGVNSWGTNVIKGWSDFGNTLVHPQVTNTNFAVNAGVDLAQSGVSFIKAFFTPVSDLFTKAASVPGPIGAVADGVNKLFSVAGVEGGDLMEGAVNAIPFVSQQTKDAITPIMKEIGSLGGQIILGKGGDMAKTEIVAKTKALVTTIASDPTLNAHAVAQPTAPKAPGVGNEIRPTQTPAEAPIAPTETPAAPTASPITPENPELLQSTPEVPTVPQGTPTGMEPAKPSGTPLEPATGTPIAQPTEPTPIAPKAISDGSTTIPTETANTAETPPVPTGVSSIGKSIEAKAVEAKLTQGFDKTAGYDKLTIKDQAERATKLLNTSLDDARAVVRGDKPLPEGLRGTALITAMEEHLKANPSAEVAHELANSPLVSKTSAAAQEMRLAAERMPDSLTAKFQEIKAAREAALEKKGGVKKAVKQMTDDIQKEIRKQKVTPKTWSDFVEQIKCNY